MAATATLHTEKKKGNRQAAPSQTALQALLSNFWGSSQQRVARGDSVSPHSPLPRRPCHCTQD